MKPLRAYEPVYNGPEARVRAVVQFMRQAVRAKRHLKSVEIAPFAPLKRAKLLVTQRTAVAAPPKGVPLDLAHQGTRLGTVMRVAKRRPYVFPAKCVALDRRKVAALVGPHHEVVQAWPLL